MTVESLDTFRALLDAVAEVQNFDARQSHCGVSPVRPELQIHNDIVLCIEIPGNNADLNIIPRSPFVICPCSAEGHGKRIVSCRCSIVKDRIVGKPIYIRGIPVVVFIDQTRAVLLPHRRERPTLLRDKIGFRLSDRDGDNNSICILCRKRKDVCSCFGNDKRGSRYGCKRTCSFAVFRISYVDLCFMRCAPCESELLARRNLRTARLYKQITMPSEKLRSREFMRMESYRRQNRRR